MKILQTIFIAMLVIGFMQGTQAEPVNVPVTNIDFVDSNDPSTVYGYRLYCNGARVLESPDPQARTFVIADATLPDGNYGCHVRTVSLDQLESDPPAQECSFFTVASGQNFIVKNKPAAPAGCSAR